MLADPFASLLRSPPPAAAGEERCSSTEAGSGTTATRILPVLYPDVQAMVARFLPRRHWRDAWGAVVDPYPRSAHRRGRRMSGGVLEPVGNGDPPMAHPGIHVVYDTVGTGDTAEW